MPDATERKVLVMTTFIAACISLAPQDWVSAGTLLVVSGLLLLANLAITRREDELLGVLERWAPSPLPASAASAEHADAALTQEAAAEAEGKLDPL